MYFVDRQKIEQNLIYLEKNSKLYQETKQWEGNLGQLSLERIIHVMTDCVLDVSNAIIDGFIMRDPGSYEDIVDILLDEKVISKEMEQQFKNVLPLRKNIVQDYLDVDYNALQATFTQNIAAFLQFPTAVRQYLENELGPVSAFIN
ncbi:DUF86 domain-containing protein [Bacillus massiliigorillae]|uniref:DUF86 domain-containing protein n=1 Tax=Bacillus massiliigorillae TaxID=1243664 RepID=UPI00039C804F|nr:DUF86 domain-containing protein [Bacillus massiliigorillae]